MKNPSALLNTIASAPVLEAGSRHPALEQVQRLLGTLGYLDAGYATGILDERTASALREYQRLNHLPQSGILDVETRDRLARPRCGLADSIGAIHFKAHCPWDRLKLTFAFGAGTADIQTPGDSEFEAVRNAFRTWAATGYFCFREVRRQDDPDILIGWLGPSDPDWIIDPSISAKAYATYPHCPAPSEKRPLLLHFNDEEVNWSLDAYPPFTSDVETIALHEIGHCLGLSHSGVPEAVMTSIPSDYFPGGERRTLHPDDLAGLAALYGTNVARQMANTVVMPVRHHFGNEASSLPGVFAGQSRDFHFDCPGIDVDADAILTFQARHVDHEQNILTVNGRTIHGGVPVTSGDESWAAQTLLIASGDLRPTDNVLHVESRTENGGTSGDLDDFVLDNVTVLYRVLERGIVITLPSQPGAG